MHKATLTPDEAERIVVIVEQILASPKLPYGYPLSELQGNSRIDVAHALMISIADVIKKSKNYPDFKVNIDKLGEAMDSSLVHIAMRGIPDKELDRLDNKNETIAIVGLTGKWSLIPMPGENDHNSSIIEERAVFGNLEMPSSIAEYCLEELNISDPDYWPKVYSRIGLEYPSWHFKNPKRKTVNEIISNTFDEKPKHKPYPLPKSVEDDLKDLRPQNQLKILEKLHEIQLRDRELDKQETTIQPEKPPQPILSKESLLRATIEMANEYGLTAKEAFGKARSMYAENNITLKDIEIAMSPNGAATSDAKIETDSTTNQLKSKNTDHRAWQLKAYYSSGIILYAIIFFLRLPYINWNGQVDIFGLLSIIIIFSFLGMFALQSTGAFMMLCFSCVLWIGYVLLYNHSFWSMTIPIITLILTFYILRKKWNGIYSEWDEFSD